MKSEEKKQGLFLNTMITTVRKKSNVLYSKALQKQSFADWDLNRGIKAVVLCRYEKSYGDNSK